MNEGKKRKLIEAAIELAAEEGMHGLSMKKVVEKAKTSETLIYQHFENKEGLYFACFKVINDELRAFFDNYVWKETSSREELHTMIHGMWMDFFTYLIEHRNRTIFYFSYRNSSYIIPFRDEAMEGSKPYYDRFEVIFQELNADHGINLNVNRKILWSFILDTTSSFARRIIQGELEDTPETREDIWRLLSFGLFGSK